MPTLNRLLKNCTQLLHIGLVLLEVWTGGLNLPLQKKLPSKSPTLLGLHVSLCASLNRLVWCFDKFYASGISGKFKFSSSTTSFKAKGNVILKQDFLKLTIKL